MAVTTLINQSFPNPLIESSLSMFWIIFSKLSSRNGLESEIIVESCAFNLNGYTNAGQLVKVAS